MTAPRTDGRVALAMAPGEARRIARSVAFLVFVLLTILAMDTASTPTNAVLASIEVAVGLVPLGWCLLVLTDLATLRDKRHGVNMFTDTLPASQTARTGGHLLGGLVGVPVSVVLLAIWLFLSPDRVGSPDLLELVVPLLLVAGGAVLGVAVARWLPWALMTVPVILITIFITGKVGEARISRTRFLGFIANGSQTGLPSLEVRPTALHLLWLLAWTAMMAVVALLRYDRSRGLIGITVAIGAVIVVAGAGQLRPVATVTAAERADVLNRPSEHQRCVTEGNATYCAYPATNQNVGQWKATTRAVLDHVPTAVAQRPLVVSQRIPYAIGNSNCGTTKTLEHMDAPIARAVSVPLAWPADGQVHPMEDDKLPCSEESLKGLFTATQVGSWAVGLPPAQWEKGKTCAADGQARSAVALWLGTTNGGRLAAFFDNIKVTGGGRGDVSDWDDPPSWGVTWHATDIEAALAMADLPDAQVDQVLADHWDELVDPATKTSQLLQLLGLPAVDAPGDPIDDCLAP